jgi:hypothetical protein
MSQREVVSSFHIKHVMFWCVELCSCQWVDSNYDQPFYYIDCGIYRGLNEQVRLYIFWHESEGKTWNTIVQ